MATQIDLGAVVPIGKGDWNEGTTYERANIVRHNSVAWICKVDSSIGVEPTEDSSDWYLLVKDTSSVTSVNGQRGDVNLDLITSEEVDSKVSNLESTINSKLPNTMVGATNEINGTSGLVPKPNAGDNKKFLKGDGKWSEIPISDAVNKQSSTTFASSTAVKTAYDKAVSAQSIAETAQNTANSAKTSVNSILSTVGASNAKLLTISGTYTATKTGPHLIIIVGGGGGGGTNPVTSSGGGAGGGRIFTVSLNKGQSVSYTIGGGGAVGAAGGTTTFNGVSVSGGSAGDSGDTSTKGGNILTEFGSGGGAGDNRYRNGGYSLILHPYGTGGKGKDGYGNAQAGTQGAILVIS